MQAVSIASFLSLTHAHTHANILTALATSSTALFFLVFLPLGVLNEIVHQQLTRRSSLRRLPVVQRFNLLRGSPPLLERRVHAPLERPASDGRRIDSIITPIIMSVGIKRLNVLQRFYGEPKPAHLAILYNRNYA